ncbi:putative plant self-incompatibility S1 [Helianthus annuus]|nr:putative plant self-incompatibility S1 [Helianthus annuus]
MKSLIFFFFCLVITTNTSSITNTSIAPPEFNTTNKICMYSYWTVYIYNEISDPISVHVQSGDDDLGNRTLALKENENWSFCEAITLKTLYYAHFYWNSKIAFFDVFDNDSSNRYCTPWKYKVNRRCVWLVREDGFYLGQDVTPFPIGWTKLHDW